MFKFICKSLHHVRSSVKASPTDNLYLLQIHLFSSSPRYSQNRHSFTVHYLINSCGFAPEKALSASSYIKFEAPDKPDSVLAFFNHHGFTKTQISSLIRKQPSILLCDPEKTLLPKIEFLKSKGVSSTDVARILSMTPIVMKRSLENQIIPSFNVFNNFIRSEAKTIVAIKRFGGLLLVDFQTHVAHNIEILRQAGVPDACVASWLTSQPRSFMMKKDGFRQIVEEVKKMGFDPSRAKFLLAIHALRSMTKSTWEKKVEVYKKWGWSEDEILAAFGKSPWCMTVSEAKINGVMDYLVNKIGLESLFIARNPTILSLSLEKRIVPRCAVYQVLLSKGLIKKAISLATVLGSPERYFLERFVNCHGEEALELLKLYKEKLELAK